MDNYKGNNLIKGALILTVAAFISKILSAFYRIPLQNLTGDFGFYVYQQVYPFIATVMILSLYSFPTAISKLSVTMLQKNEGKLSLYSFYMPLLFILIMINGSFLLILFLYSNRLGKLIGDPNLASSFQLIAFSFLLIPFVSLFRGVFQAYGEMRPTAYSQVLEQLVRIMIIIVVSYVIFSRHLSVYMIGKFGAIATLFGLITSCLLLIILFIKKRPYTLHSFTIPWKFYIKTIILFGFVAALNHMVLIIIQFADVLTVVPSLINYGFSAVEAKQLKGIFDRGQPLIQFGTIIGSSFALALIPAVSSRELKQQNLSDALLISFYISAAAATGLVILMPEVNLLLFKDLSETLSLRILASSILLTSIILTANALLQGLGYTLRTACYILVILCLKLVLNIVLIPLWGLIGSAVATVLSLTVLACLSLIGLHRKTKLLNMFVIVQWRPFLGSVLMMALCLLIIKFIFPISLFQSRILLLIYVLFLVGIGALIYLFMLVRYNVLSKEQLAVLPGGRYVMKWQRQK